jgi:diguanylate cyclase (GGDEF)-like protein
MDPISAIALFLAGATSGAVALLARGRLRGESNGAADDIAARASELAKVVELNEYINAAIRIEDVLNHVYDSLRGIIPYDRIGLAVLDSDRIVLRAIWGRSERAVTGIKVGYEAPLQSSSLARVLQSGEPRIISDLERYLEDHPESESTRRIVADGIRSSLTLPLRALGEPVGTLFFSSFERGSYDDAHTQFLKQIAGQISLVVAKSKLYEDLLDTKGRLEAANRDLEALATADGLTGLANRRAFDAALRAEWRRAVRSGNPLSLLMIDVDHFKQFNDDHGHIAGDECLQIMATALAAHARRAGDVVARYGGEEFAMLLPDTPPEDAMAIADHIRSNVEVLAYGPNGDEPMTVSIGVHSLIPYEEGIPASLVQGADDALYQAKRGGRNRVNTAFAQRQPA